MARGGASTVTWSTTCDRLDPDGGVAVVSSTSTCEVTCVASNASGVASASLPVVVAGAPPPARAAAPAGGAPPPKLVRDVVCDPPTVGTDGSATCRVEIANLDGAVEFSWSAKLGEIGHSPSPEAKYQPPPYTAGFQPQEDTISVTLRARGVTIESSTKLTVRTVRESCALASRASVKPAELTLPLPPSPTEIANRLRDAGFPANKDGVIVTGPGVGGLAPGYDPKQAETPVAGAAACVGQVTACIAVTRSGADACVLATRRCKTRTPWLGDPAGRDCCPDTCVDAYFHAREVTCDSQATKVFLHSSCYPGLPDHLRRLP